ncbi:MAG: 3-keto-5-aminohexanoate cleavage protein, partial [Gammaproteobacteria bacterium]|nr:3-keto-5-aminohexanoate cleavage protein [Gammaproteobacteria bacterium]
ALPVTAREVAQTALECAAAGAAMIHLHVRDDAGAHSLDPHRYQTAIQVVKEAVGERLVIQITSEAVGMFTPQQQMTAIRAVRPEAVSLAIRELVPDREHERPAAEFFSWLSAEHVVPQYILYSVDELRRYFELLKRQVIPSTPHWLLFVLGRYTTGQTSDPRWIVPFVAELDREVPWSICAFGAQEHACAVCAAALGGHARVGFENNLFLKDGSRAANNAELIAQLRTAMDALGRPIASADELRARFTW